MEEGRTIRVGRIVGPHGVHGGLRVEVLTDFPSRFEPGRIVLVCGKPVRIQDCSWHGTQARIHLEGVESVEAAEALRWEYLAVPETDRPVLEEGQYEERELVGCAVVDPEGKVLGTMRGVAHAPAHDLWIVDDVLVPAVREFVKEVDLDSRKITIDPLPGLFDEAE